MASQPSGAASSRPSWTRGRGMQPDRDAPAKCRDARRAVARWRSFGAGHRPWPEREGLPGSLGEPFELLSARTQPPRSVVQASTQSSWVTQVVAASVSLQSSCGVAQ